MAEEKHEDFGFKVVDRRSFAEGGERREDEREGEAAPAETRKPEPPRSAPPPRDARRDPVHADADTIDSSMDEADFGEERASGFEMLVSYLSTTAMFQLGLLPGPGGERIPADYANARRTIDMLEVLQDKTKGNLTRDEDRLLQDVLYELRLSFVEVQKRSQKTR
jgi:hypothetical protein